MLAKKPARPSTGAAGWFYPKYFAEVAGKLVRWTALYIKLRRIYLSIKSDPERFAYSDIAMTAVAADEAETHELFDTDAARAFIEQRKRVKQAQGGGGEAEPAFEPAE